MLFMGFKMDIVNDHSFMERDNLVVVGYIPGIVGVEFYSIVYPR